MRPLRGILACKPAFELEYFREAAIYRLIELAEATFILLDIGNYLSAVVTARSLDETFSVIWYLNELCAHVIKNKELVHFTKEMEQLMLDWKGQDELPEPKQILNLIDKVNKKVPGYRKHYDALSEYVHPNRNGTMGLFEKPSRVGKLKVEFGRYIRGRKEVLVHIEATLLATIDLFQFAQSEYANIIDGFTEVCYDLHDKGELKEQIQPATRKRD